MLLSRRELSRFLVAGCLMGPLASNAIALGGRQVRFEILIDGKLAFLAKRDDDGKVDPDAVWRYLDYLELTPAKNLAITPDEDDPRRATIKGKLTIQARYGGKVEIDELKLFRSRPTDPWRIDRKEVQRTFQIRERPKQSAVDAG